MGAQMQVERISSLMKFIAYRSIEGRSIRGGVQLQGGVLFFNLYARGSGLLEGKVQFGECSVIDFSCN